MTNTILDYNNNNNQYKDTLNLLVEKKSLERHYKQLRNDVDSTEAIKIKVENNDKKIAELVTTIQYEIAKSKEACNELEAKLKELGDKREFEQRFEEQQQIFELINNFDNLSEEELLNSHSDVSVPTSANTSVETVINNSTSVLKKFDSPVHYFCHYAGLEVEDYPAEGECLTDKQFNKAFTNWTTSRDICMRPEVSLAELNDKEVMALFSWQNNNLLKVAYNLHENIYTNEQYSILSDETLIRLNLIEEEAGDIDAIRQHLINCTSTEETEQPADIISKDNADLSKDNTNSLENNFNGLEEISTILNSSALKLNSSALKIKEKEKEGEEKEEEEYLYDKSDEEIAEERDFEEIEEEEALREYEYHLAEDKYLESMHSSEEVSINIYEDINTSIESKSPLSDEELAILANDPASKNHLKEFLSKRVEAHKEWHQYSLDEVLKADKEILRNTGRQLHPIAYNFISQYAPLTNTTSIFTREQYEEMMKTLKAAFTDSDGNIIDEENYRNVDSIRYCLECIYAPSLRDTDGSDWGEIDHLVDWDAHQKFLRIDEEEAEIDAIDVDSEVDNTFLLEESNSVYSTKSNWHRGTLSEAMAAPDSFFDEDGLDYIQHIVPRVTPNVEYTKETHDFIVDKLHKESSQIRKDCAVFIEFGLLHYFDLDHKEDIAMNEKTFNKVSDYLREQKFIKKS